MPGDCSPSRSVVSKMMTRSSGMSLFPFSAPALSPIGMRLRAAAGALFPPKGEEKGEKEAAKRHALRKISGDEHDLADVAAFLEQPVGLGRALERDARGHARADDAGLEQVAERPDPRLECARRVPQGEQVEPDDRLGGVH